MRWVVEVSSIGKTDLQHFCVEAETWQLALQAARTQRGDREPMSGFSTEHLDEGYRAVDPLARVRFLVKRAPDDMALTSPTKAGPPRPSTADKSASPSPSGAIGSALPGLPSIKVLASREQSPTDSAPLTYREYAFAVPAGTSEAIAAEVLRGQLRLVEAQLASAKMGKLVNLAVFDFEFTGKPPSPPLATLSWKDWKGEPVLTYPRAASPKAGRTVTIAPAVMAPTPATPARPSTVETAAAKSPETPAASPPPATASATPTPALSPSERSPTATIPAPPPDLVVPSPSPPQEQANAADNARPARGRVSGDELISSLFESMHDLHFLRDALDGGQFCLSLATEMLPSRAAFVHFFDIEKREWVIACTRGKDTTRLLTLRSPETDAALREATRVRRAIVLADVGKVKTQRYQSLGGAKSVIIAPIMQAGRALGALEIMNPLDDLPFTAEEGNAMTYIAEQYAEYLGSRGIVLDRERIQRAAAR